MFQSTRPRGARRTGPDKMDTGLGFHSTRPRGARLPFAFIFFNIFGFNPRAHAGRDFRHFFMLVIIYDVSIHAPTRGATYIGCKVSAQMYVSIHAPTRGATFAALSVSNVQSVSIHAPTRGATLKKRGDQNDYYVSIHAPTRGATGVGVGLGV